MKTSNHTPGPYLIDDGLISMQQQAECLIDGIGTEREWVAIGPTDQDGGVSEVVALCHPINAPLIAAAPELLESEIKFVQLCNNLAVALTDEQIAEARAALISHCHDARAAIAKATQNT